MAIVSIHCPVIGLQITRVTDLEGATTRVICPQYEESTGICRLKRQGRGGGMLSQFLDRVAEDALRSKDLHCDFRR